jgi:hypothetical protein
MLATFYLTGTFSASTLSDTFTIVGNPGNISHTGILKAQLLTGHTIVFVDSVTGGTVTATNATCDGTTQPWYVIQGTSYDCINGVCTLVQGLNGVYSDLNDCEQNCSPSTGTATLAWSFTETGGARGEMNLYVNGSEVVNRFINSTGTLTVNAGDTINVEVICDECGSNYSNAYCGGIIVDSDCVEAGIATIITSVYTVQIADIGNTLDLNTFARCDSGCI